MGKWRGQIFGRQAARALWLACISSLSTCTATTRSRPRRTRQRLQSSLDDSTFEQTPRGHRFRQGWPIHAVALAAGEDAAPR